jgi:hypothetical protein
MKDIAQKIKLYFFYSIYGVNYIDIILCHQMSIIVNLFLIKF